MGHISSLLLGLNELWLLLAVQSVMTSAVQPVLHHLPHEQYDQ